MTSLRNLLPFVISFVCIVLLVAPAAASGYDSGDVTNAEKFTKAEGKAQSSEIIITAIDTVVPDSTAGKVIGGTGVGAVVAANGYEIYASTALNAANSLVNKYSGMLSRVAHLKDYSDLANGVYKCYTSLSVEATKALESAKSTATVASNIARTVNYIAGYGALLYCGYLYCDKSTELIQDAYVQHGVEFDHTLLNW